MIRFCLIILILVSLISVPDVFGATPTSGNFCAGTTFSSPYIKQTSCGSLSGSSIASDGNAEGTITYHAPATLTASKTCTVKVDRNVDCSITASSTSLAPDQSVTITYKPICDDDITGCSVDLKINVPSTASAQSPAPTSVPTVKPTQTPVPTASPKPTATPKVSATTRSTSTPQASSSQAPAPSDASATTAQNIVVTPKITLPKDGEKLSGQVSIQVSAEGGSYIDLQLQVTSINIGTLLLDRVFVPNNQNSVIYSWDTKNTPNGNYQLFAIVNKDDSEVIAGPVKLTVDNTQITIEQLIENNPNKVVSSQVTFESNKTQQKSGEDKSQTEKQTKSVDIKSLVVTETTKDIIFPSKFDPQTTIISTNTKIEKVENTKTEENNVALTFQGVSEPNKIVYLLIYSNPIVVSVKADANGVWKYSLEKTLPAGKHNAYLVLPTEEGVIRSEVAEFFISPAYAASANNESLVLASASTSFPFAIYILVTVLVITGGVGALLFVYKNREENPPPQVVA